MSRILHFCRFTAILFFLIGLPTGILAQIYPVPGGDQKQDTHQYMGNIPKGFSEVPYFTFGSGIGIFSPDSLYSFNLRFRIQNRAAFTFKESSLDEVEARVRRLRLRFDGFVYSPKIYYVVQLSFSREDMDWQNTGVPNIIRDAMIFYKPHPKLQLGFGQTKLPGNRQRVNSSGDLQFADRSIVNARLNVDRDFGLQAAYTENIFKRFYTVFRAALTTGEGRNILATGKGLAYTGRVEILPFGLFEKFGDYFEGDLIREQRPKVSAGFTYSYNESTLKTGGQIGIPLFEARDMTTLATDWLLKYNGFSLASEFLYRDSQNPLTFNGTGDVRYIYTGLGQNYQAGYIFPSNYELALRYSRMDASGVITSLEPDIQHFTVGATKYLKGHRLKFQTDLTYELSSFATSVVPQESFYLRFQLELGI